jgi:hypothetical protein
VKDLCQPRLDRTTKSEQSIQLANKWLHDCASNHHECLGLRKDAKLPSRLVHVRRQRDCSELEARLCCSNTIPAGTSYLSLSHCWGEYRFITTTRDNFSQFQASLPIDSLSHTFQDALLLTIALGFEYIWIDSLCIVQDDINDWRREASRMGDVYRNPGCNISVSGFTNGQEGFMLPQRRPDPTPILVKAERGHSVICGIISKMKRCISWQARVQWRVCHKIHCSLEPGHCKNRSL